MHPLVSVILPVYNREASIARAVRSVLEQTYRPIELIVVDDGSTDGTLAALEPFREQITLLQAGHAGPYAARNLAMRHARGELIAFHDSDDAWLPGRLALQVPLFEREPVGLVYGDARVVTPAGPTRRTQFGITPPHRGRVAAQFRWGNFVPTVTVLVRRRCLDDFEEVALSADYLAWFRVALRHELDYVDDIVADYTVHEAGISYDLARSLDARIALFSGELARSTDPEMKKLIRPILFNLSLHLVIAAIRGRTQALARSLRDACRYAWSSGRSATALWTLRFLAYHAFQRGRRLFA